jgi:small-conductance mechanosensitive channel
VKRIAAVFEPIRELFRALGCLPIVAVVAVCFLSSVNAFAAEQNAPEAPKPAPPAPAADIPLADIAARATEVSNLLGNLAASAVPGAQIESIAKSLPESSEKLDAQFAATTESLETEPTLDMLQSLQQDWQRRQLETTGWLSALTTRATKLQDALNQLSGLQKIWGSTRASAQAAEAPGPILQQIDATLTAITAAQAKIESERTALLDLQSRVGQQITKCDTVLAQIGQIQQQAVAGILVPNAPPLWNFDAWADGLETLPEHVRRVGSAHWSVIVNYVSKPSGSDALLVALFIVQTLVFYAARRKITVWEKSSTDASSAILVFERPYAAALSATLVWATAPVFFPMPTVVRQLLSVLALVPMLRLLPPMMRASVAFVIHMCCLLFAVDILRQAFSGIRLIGMAIVVGESLAAIIVLYLARHHYRQMIAERAESSRLIVLKLGRSLLIIALIVALLAGVLGYARLARLLTPGILVGGVLGLMAVATLRVWSGVITLAFRVWPLCLVQMVEHHREFLERRIYRLLVWVVALGWLARYLNYLGLLDSVWSLGQALLATKLERGTISISVGNILEFWLVVLSAYLLSRFLRFVLQEDVYPRIDLAPGLSYAVSSLLNYIVLALGFVAGLGVLGVDFSKVSIMAGAFGVGIGFGLQSIVNNFVSGLILLFERPVHVGDMVQVSNVQGRVQRIGIRASIIRTMQGSEIIVPNAQLIAEQVTNWTLSDQLRRVDLPVGVSYGTAPKKMIELLEGVARSHPKVLTNPAPRALFMGYGDSSINFELRAWSEYANWQQVHSDLTVAVYDALYAAGITIPFPQRDVHVISAPAASEKDAPVEPPANAKKHDPRAP